MMVFEKVETAVLPVYKVPSSKGDEFYYITVFENPDAKGKHLVTCSCPDFQLGRPRRGVNPFAEPCKHVKAFNDQALEV